MKLLTTIFYVPLALLAVDFWAQLICKTGILCATHTIIDWNSFLDVWGSVFQ